MILILSDKKAWMGFRENCRCRGVQELSCRILRPLVLVFFHFFGRYNFPIGVRRRFPVRNFSLLTCFGIITLAHLCSVIISFTGQRNHSSKKHSSKHKHLSSPKRTPFITQLYLHVESIILPQNGNLDSICSAGRKPRSAEQQPR
jgi:hypothetical protein